MDMHFIFIHASHIIQVEFHRGRSSDESKGGDEDGEEADPSQRTLWEPREGGLEPGRSTRSLREFDGWSGVDCVVVIVVVVVLITALDFVVGAALGPGQLKG